MMCTVIMLYCNQYCIFCVCHRRKELDLLQKLYGLYDAVMSKIGGYYTTLWTKVDPDVINTELLEFQNRYSKCL